MRKSIIAISIFLTLFAFFGGTGHATPKPAGEFTKEEAIQRFFSNKDLDPMEGIWKSTVWKDEFIIVKNNFGLMPESRYIGLFLKENGGVYENGEIAYTFIPTASNQIFTGVTYGYTKSLFIVGRRTFDTTFVATSRNTIAVKAEFLGRDSLIKLYPTASDSSTLQQNQISTGTGFFISSDLIVTNNHVVANAKDIEITLSNGTKYPCTIATKDPSNDLAVIRPSQPIDGINPLPLGQVRDVRSGDQVFTIGFPLGSKLGSKAKISEGIINNTAGIDDDVRMFQISIPIQPGNSGGPLFNARGQVIGVVSSGLGLRYLLRAGIIPQNVNFAMKINYLPNLLSNLPEDVKLPNGGSDHDLNARQTMDLSESSVVFIKVTTN